MISEEKAESALNYLVETDESCAMLKADVERTEFKLKAIKAAMFNLHSGTVADRQAAAEVSPEVQNAWAEYCSAISRYNAVANKRDTQKIIIDLYRTISANMRKGT